MSETIDRPFQLELEQEGAEHRALIFSFDGDKVHATIITGTEGASFQMTQQQVEELRRWLSDAGEL